MELSLRGRGVTLTEQVWAKAERKLAKLARLNPRLVRAEVEVIDEPNPRLDGAKRVEASVETPRHTYRAHAQASSVDAALDQLVDRLERQIRDEHGKRRGRSISTSNRVRSARTSPEGAGPE
jgi:ribosomal subunit interface protein